MAWENKIVGFTVETFSDIKGKPIIPPDAIFLAVTESSYHTYGTKFHGQNPIGYFLYHYHIPIYKKVRVKKK